MFFRLVALISRQIFRLVLMSCRSSRSDGLGRLTERKTSPWAKVSHQRMRRQNAEGPESDAVLFSAALVTWEP